MDARALTSHRGRRVALATTALVMLTSSGCAKQHDRNTARLENGQQSVQIELVDNAYRPLTVGAKGDVRLVVHLHNEGLQHHTFTEESSGVDVELSPGDKRTIDIPSLPAGEDRHFLCRFHEANGMKGKISYVETL